MAQQHVFKVAMTCEGCSTAVERVLGKLKGKGIDDFKTDLKDQTVTVTTSMDKDQVLEVIKKAGKACEFLKTV